MSYCTLCTVYMYIMHTAVGVWQRQWRQTTNDEDEQMPHSSHNSTIISVQLSNVVWRVHVYCSRPITLTTDNYTLEFQNFTLIRRFSIWCTLYVYLRFHYVTNKEIIEQSQSRNDLNEICIDAKMQFAVILLLCLCFGLSVRLSHSFSRTTI